MNARRPLRSTYPPVRPVGGSVLAASVDAWRGWSLPQGSVRVRCSGQAAWQASRWWGRAGVGSGNGTPRGTA